MNLALSSEQEEIRRLARDFAEREVRPRAAAIDQEVTFPRDLVEKAAALGLLGILVPEAYGGAGLDHVSFAIFIEEVARFSASTAVIVDVHTSVGTEPIVLFGSEDQKRRWLPELAEGKQLAAFALTEPDAGSDAAHLQTTATRGGAGYVLNGSKIFITNAGEAGRYIVMATTRPGSGAAGVTAFVVGAENPGMKIGPPFKKMGLNGSAIAEGFFEGCEVPEADRLGEEVQGFADRDARVGQRADRHQRPGGRAGPGRARRRRRLCEGAQAVRQADCRAADDPEQARGHVGQGPGRALDDVEGGRAVRRRAALHERGLDGEALRDRHGYGGNP